VAKLSGNPYYQQNARLAIMESAKMRGHFADTLNPAAKVPAILENPRTN
jgi:hypothetical protein